MRKVVVTSTRLTSLSKDQPSLVTGSYRFPDNSVTFQLLLVFAVIRFVYAMGQRSWHHADEHWQGPEVAYRLVFGSEEKTWEWLENVALRSHLHPLMFATFYQVLSWLGLYHALAIAYGPRLVQGFLTALGDVAFYLISRKLFGRERAAQAVSIYATCWFGVFTLSRTTSNSADAAVTLLGLCGELDIDAAECALDRWNEDVRHRGRGKKVNSGG